VVAGKVYVTVDQSTYPGGLVNRFDASSYLLALNAADGKVLWRTPTIEARQLAPAVQDQVLVTGTEKGELIAYDAQTGKEMLVTVKLNGELVVDNTVLENYWDRNQPIFPKEQIELQCHGDPIEFKNIYIREL